MKSLIIALLLFIFINHFGKSQTVNDSTKDPDRESIHDTENVEPAINRYYPVGSFAFENFIAENMIVPQLVTFGLKGEVWLTVDIDSLGSVKELRILKRMPECDECNSEALRLAKSVHNWLPHKTVGGRTIDYDFIFCIKFPPKGFITR